MQGLSPSELHYTFPCQLITVCSCRGRLLSILQDALFNTADESFTRCKDTTMPSYLFFVKNPPFLLGPFPLRFLLYYFPKHLSERQTKVPFSVYVHRSCSTAHTHTQKPEPGSTENTFVQCMLTLSVYSER